MSFRRCCVGLETLLDDLGAPLTAGELLQEPHSPPDVAVVGLRVVTLGYVVFRKFTQHDWYLRYKQSPHRKKLPTFCCAAVAIALARVSESGQTLGAVANGSIINGGEVIGVIPDFLKLKEVVHTGLTKLITTSNMHQRKLKMHELSDGFITLPGGFGTLEELFEIITWAQLGLHQKPIGLLNINGFYSDLLKMLNTMVRTNLLKSENLRLLTY